MISKFQELQEKQTNENAEIIKKLAEEYAVTRAELNKSGEEYNQLNLDYNREKNATQKIILNRRLRDLEETILNLNSKLEAQEVEMATLKYTNVDYDLADIKKDIAKYLKSKKVDSFGKRFIEAKDQYIKAIESIHDDARLIHSEIQGLKNALLNNFTEEELNKQGISNAYEKISIDGEVDTIDLKFSSVDLIEDIPDSLELFIKLQRTLTYKIKDTYQIINNI